MITRRLFSLGLMAAPAIIRPGVLMRVRPRRLRLELPNLFPENGPLTGWDASKPFESEGSIPAFLTTWVDPEILRILQFPAPELGVFS